MNLRADNNNGNGAQPMAQALRGRAAAFLREEAGVTAIEYALLGALIAVAIIGGVSSVGTQLNTLFSSVASAVAQAV